MMLMFMTSSFIVWYCLEGSVERKEEMHKSKR